jgi:hypothetical protein
MGTGVKTWAREHGYTDEKIVGLLAERGLRVHAVSLNRYLNGHRAFPLNVVVALKGIANGALQDSDFVVAGPKARRHKRAA